MISSIKMIKFNNWEGLLVKEIKKYRRRERLLLFVIFSLEGIGRSISNFFPLLSALICFWIYTTYIGELSVSDSFSLILLFSNLIHPILQSLDGIVIR